MLYPFKRFKLITGRPFSFVFLGPIGKCRKQKFIASFKSGDKESFSTAYQKFRKPILNHVLARVRDRHLAEEITQDIFLKAYRFRSLFDPTYEFSTWIWTIARNTLADWFRKNRTALSYNGDSGEPQWTGADDLPCFNPNPEVALIESADRDALVQVMNSLDETHKKVLSMRLIYQLPYAEIAKRLGLSLSAVKCLIHRAKANVMRKIAKADTLELALETSGELEG